MGLRPASGLSKKRCDSWDSDTTYHSVHIDQNYSEDAEAFIHPEPNNHPYNHNHSKDDVKQYTNIDGHDGPSRERPKIPLRRGFSWTHPLVHLLPVAATLGVLQLSFRGVYWDDEAAYDTRWGAILQFPAKLHEILIVGSLSAMVLQ
jgi:hypothetical protein